MENKCHGKEKNSIRICTKGGMVIDGSWTEFKYGYELFKKGDIIGIGIIQQSNLKMECFGTSNGKFLGKIIIISINKYIEFRESRITIKICEFPTFSSCNFGQN